MDVYYDMKVNRRAMLRKLPLYAIESAIVDTTAYAPRVILVDCSAVVRVSVISDMH